MTDRDRLDAATPDPDGIPKEPSKYELSDPPSADDQPSARPAGTQDDARAKGDRADDLSSYEADLERAAANDDDLDYPATDEEFDEYDEAQTVNAIPPNKIAAALVGVLAFILLGLGVVVAQQDVNDYMPTLNDAQIEGVAKLLDEEGVRDFSDEQITAAQDRWEEDGATRNLNPELLAGLFNSFDGPTLTADQIQQTLDNKQATLQSAENVQSSFRSQMIMFFVTGALAAAAAFFYLRGQRWARILGMFVSGFIALMYGMQAIQGSANLLVLLIVLIAAVGFTLMMRGRLDDAPTGGGGLFSGMFVPRRPRSGA